MCKSKSRLGTVLLFNVLIISDKSRFNACSSGIVVLRLVAEKSEVWYFGSGRRRLR